MKEGDIYFYNARWYDPQLGRFMQADTFVPTVQGTQAWDRFAYTSITILSMVQTQAGTGLSRVGMTHIYSTKGKQTGAQSFHLRWHQVQ